MGVPNQAEVERDLIEPLKTVMKAFTGKHNASVKITIEGVNGQPLHEIRRRDRHDTTVLES